MLVAQGTKSLRKKSLENEHRSSAGFKRIPFYHEANAGETVINFAALRMPAIIAAAGKVQATAADLQSANLFFFPNNLTLISSLSGILQPVLSYTIDSSLQVTLSVPAEQGEIFIGYIDANRPASFVDARALVHSGSLPVGQTDLILNEVFEVNKYPLHQVGAVLVFRNGELQMRNVGNAPASPGADGNYQEVVGGLGVGQIIRFNSAPSETADAVVVVSNGLLVERPDASMMARIETVAGQLDKIISVLSDVSGQPKAYFQDNPSSVDLAAFSTLVTGINSRLSSIETGPKREELRDFQYVDANRVLLPPSTFWIGPDLVSSTADVYLDLDNNGIDNGAAKVPGSWYAVYALKSGATFSLKASLNLPPALGGLGPVTSAPYRYLGLIKNGITGTFNGLIPFLKTAKTTLFSAPPIAGGWSVGPYVCGAVLMINSQGTDLVWTKSIGMGGNQVPFHGTYLIQGAVPAAGIPVFVRTVNSSGNMTHVYTGGQIDSGGSMAQGWVAIGPNIASIGSGASAYNATVQRIMAVAGFMDPLA